MNFQTIPPICLQYGNTAINFAYSNTSMSDISGNLLFYSNGFSVANANHQIMQNGDSLSCCTDYFDAYHYWGANITQGVLALPQPDSFFLYYLFHESFAYGGIYGVAATKLSYSIIDMRLGNWLGAITQKNIPLINDTVGWGGLTACRHANGRDWWLLVREFDTNKFYRFLLTPNGIMNMGTQSIGDNIPQVAGQTIFSPDGSKYVIAGVDDGIYTHLFTYNFDRCTGWLYSPQHYDIENTPSSSCSGIAFSENSRFLYYSVCDKLYQLDLSSNNILASRQLIAISDGYQDSTSSLILGFDPMQLAPDNKIYISSGNSQYLHTIDSPNLLGTACNVNQHSYKLKKRNSVGSIPNFPHYRLGREIGSACDTIYTSISPPQESVGIQVYPNPAQESLTIELPQKEEAEFVLFDITGRVVLSQKLWKLTETVSLAHLPKGMYFYLLKSEKGILAQGKVVKE